MAQVERNLRHYLLPNMEMLSRQITSNQIDYDPDGPKQFAIQRHNDRGPKLTSKMIPSAL
ncbi:hypothetical protein EPI10_032143 [Gossypium australe]|uniref:Uncharacterized protein n=1 Tax=Gossypium australe TaxID=47621 RepID=A0A5B6X5H4_9ROSI|nr:hypothetical protein EPI10_032143 [Gossypium australe]